MAHKKQIVLLVVAVAVVLIGTIISQVISRIPWTVDIEGTVTALDVPGRRATLAFIAPWNGQHKEMSGSIPEDCQIYINDQKASFEDVQVGDEVEAQIEWLRDKKEPRPLVIRITRPATTQEAAASRPEG